MVFNDSFKALADPTRRQILEMLKKGDLSVNEIASKFEISQPSISRHLSILKTADLVSDERKGQQIIYSLNTSVFESLVGWFMSFRDKGETHYE
ncbi:winged helix-turn-helix transcriptional regulator [Clostridia bacterium]|nr:winged helix-turn-helix transcriptional regulator [Clostridia bacterium]